MTTVFRSFLLVFFLAAASAATRAQEAAFIAHPDVAESSLSADDVSNILLGKKTTWGSGPIKLALLSTGSVHEAVAKTFAQRSADQLDKHWKKLVFTGKGIMPAQFKTEAELLDFVSKTPGAFGYVAPGGATGSVKTIAIQ